MSQINLYSCLGFFFPLNKPKCSILCIHIYLSVCDIPTCMCVFEYTPMHIYIGTSLVNMKSKTKVPNCELKILARL